MESPAVQGRAFGGVFSSAAERSLTIATTPAEQRLPALIARHIGRDYFAALAAGGEQ
jgi:hypothetical protein